MSNADFESVAENKKQGPLMLIAVRAGSKNSKSNAFFLGRPRCLPTRYTNHLHPASLVISTTYHKSPQSGEN